MLDIEAHQDRLARQWAKMAEAENRACRQHWDPISWRGVNRLGERAERIERAVDILRKGPATTADIANKLNVQTHTICDYLRPLVVAGTLTKTKVGKYQYLYAVAE